MIPDLRARLNAVAKKVKEEAPKCKCLIRESRIPVSQIGGLAAISEEQVYQFAHVDTKWQLNQTLFIDTETTGLRGAGTVAFLIGLGWLQDDVFWVRQLLMRDYPEELDMLETLQEILSGFSCVVSFNGKSFDIPLLKDRMLLSRFPDPWRSFAHIDLLHVARRLWKARIGCCRLEALEEMILGIVRKDDIPGAQIPERYFQYLKCGELSLLEDIIRHNHQDIVSLAMLFARLATVYQAPELQQEMLDVLSAGRALEKLGLKASARRCFQVASVSTLSKQARLHLAGSYRHDGDFAQAADVYFEMINCGEAEVLDYIALAILLEHRLHEIAAALSVTEKAILRFAGNTFWHAIDTETLDALYRRRERLKKRLVHHQV